MQVYALFLVPFAAGAAAFAVRSDVVRRLLVVGTALVHSGLTLSLWLKPDGLKAPHDDPDAWLALDAAGLLFLSIVSLLFLLTSFYTVGYLRREHEESHQDVEEGFYFRNAPEAVFTGCLLLFLSAMTLVTECQHFGLLWVAVEATTLVSAPLIYFHRQHRSLEATWKYLLICSVGIALALLGNFLLAVAATPAGGTEHVGLSVGNLSAVAISLDATWLKAAFVFLLVGYGTKMGLAPMHTWLPDAHSESPSSVSALLSGALLNCAFLGILRAHQVCVAAGHGDFTRELLVGFGLLSMAVAGIFIVGQADFKRMLAYSSVEHMGILALGTGLGGRDGTFGMLLHAVNHSVTKAMLFLVAGNILAFYKTKQSATIHGMNQVVPWTTALWIAGFLAITGSPPFGVFLSEFTILKAALDQGRGFVAALYLALLVLIFVGMATIVLNMAQGEAGTSPRWRPRESPSMIVPPVILGLMTLGLGLYIPPILNNMLRTAAGLLGGGS
jgi:hydrogenase-4 component F